MRNSILFIFVSLLFASCSTLDKSRMLKTPRNFEYKQFVDSANYKEDYQIAIDDNIEIQMYSNHGYNIISLSGSTGENSSNGGLTGNRGGRAFKVRKDSCIKVPLIGKIKVLGLNLEQLESKIESSLENQFNSPFVLAKINNRRVFLFKGGSSASIIELENQNSTLFEILAKSGGITEDGNASKIKLIRGNIENPDIYLIDISTIDGMKRANMNVKAGDIIYIDPFINYASRISSDINSVMGLLSSILLVYTITQ